MVELGTFGSFKRASSDFIIKDQKQIDKDILFKGTDISVKQYIALQLDMSEGGTGQF